MLWPRSFALDRVLLFVDAEDGAFDEGDVEVAAGGVDVYAEIGRASCRERV